MRNDTYSEIGRIFYCIALFPLSLLISCAGDGQDTITLPERAESNDTAHQISTNAVPDSVQKKLAEHMNLYSGSNPTDVSGCYEIAPDTMTYATDMYIHGLANETICFSKKSALSYAFRDRQGSASDSSDNVKVIGNGNEFTAYFVSEGTSDGISTKMSTVISGVWSSSGIKDISYAFVMVEKGSDPKNTLMSTGTFRVVKDGDGLASVTSWPAARRGEMSFAGKFSNSEMQKR